ncbi:MAG: hypothetical protein A2Y24_00475 [Clostridiales bacterium GWE2_32_10]|nr:MAG: hypothetical protein A2Y24_00475 [Clostridiales bacterium GWE2_32_10]
MKYVKYIITSIFCLGLFMDMVFAEGIKTPDTIRIGLEYSYKELAKVDIASKQIICGSFDGYNFTQVFNMSSNTGFSVYTDDNFYLKFGGDYYSYDDAKATLEALNVTEVNKFLAYISDNVWNIYLGGYATQDEMYNAMGILNATYTDLNLGFVDATLTRDYIVSKDNNKKIILDNVGKYAYITTSERLMNLAARTYRGYIQFVRVDSGKITPVNTLSFNEYLYGVVPAEMSSSWPLEALKAQAIAAKNYAMLAVNSKKYKYYDISDTTNDQVYKGYSVEGENSSKAVNETAGKVLIYNEKLVSTFFFSSSGGYTENSENAWTNAVPYLRGVKDIYEPQNSNSNWEMSIKKSDIKMALLGLGKDIGDIVDLNLEKSKDTGRVQEITIVGTNGTYSLQKEYIRTSLKPIFGSVLKSRNFDVVNKTPENTVNVNIRGIDNTNNKNIYSEVYILGSDGVVKKLNTSTNTVSITGIETTKKVTPSTTNSTSDSFTIRGSGWGHGVGMSQYGAKGMAEAGFMYDEILKFYYTGTEVVSN